MLKFLRQISNADDISNIPSWRIGLSCAASWSWGVSIAVAVAIYNTMGVIPFSIWMVGNVLALPLFGIVRRFLPISRNWSRFVPFVFLFVIVEFFAIVLNLQAIRSVIGGDLDIPTYSFATGDSVLFGVMGLGLIIVAIINRWGLKASIFTDVGQYSIQIAATLILAIICLYTDQSREVSLWTEAGRKWWPVAFVGIITGALGTGHQWQRFDAIERENYLPVSLWAGLFFGLYMAMVSVVAVYFVTSFVTGLFFLIVITTIASSTIDSAVSGLQFLAKRFAAPLYVGSFIALIAVLFWPVIAGSGMTAIWTLMAKIRYPAVLILLVASIIYYILPIRLYADKIWSFFERVKLVLSKN